MADDHYATLGVDRGASAQEIKKAFRRAAMAAHSDRGGDDETMARVNRAHETLSDPERRARYDAGGPDTPQPSIDDQARTLVLQILAQAIEQEGDPIAWTRMVLAENLRRVEADRRGTQRKIARLEAKRPQVAVPAGCANLVHGLIDQQLQAQHVQLRTLDTFALQLRAAERLLVAHTYIGPATDATATFRFTTGADRWMAFDDLFAVGEKGDHRS